MIYFIKSEDNYVKIGYTKDNPQKRLLSIQGHCPLKLEIFKIIPGGFSIEKRLHSKFEKYRLHGEWFKLPKYILNEIKRGRAEEEPYVNYGNMVEKLLRWKESCNLTYYKIAQSLGVSESLMSRIANGHRTCTYKMTLKIIKAINESAP